VSNITLRRADALQIRAALRFQIAWNGPLTHKGDTAGRALAALDAALAKPEKERAETVIPARSVAGSEKPASQRDESYRTTEPPAKPEPVHPGYIIGSHWLETAYSRIAAGEAEADVLTEVLGARGWAKPEPATYEQAAAAYDGGKRAQRWVDYRDGWRDGWRDAERHHGIRKEDK
jgi:hypothetical protein